LSAMTDADERSREDDQQLVMMARARSATRPSAPHSSQREGMGDTEKIEAEAVVRLGSVAGSGSEMTGMAGLPRGGLYLVLHTKYRAVPRSP